MPISADESTKNRHKLPERSSISTLPSWQPGQSGEGRKQFFFEKKNQKTFDYWARACGQSEEVKVFCFFFSKKKTFL